MEQKLRKKKPVVYSIVHYFLLVAVSVFTIFPLFTVLITSFKGNEQVVLDPVSFVPKPFSTEGWGKVFSDFPIWIYLRNTLILTISNVIGVTFTSAMVAYAFARFNVVHKKYIFAAMLAMMMVPGTVLQIPIYELYVGFGWINRYWPFILPAFLGGGITNVFLIRQFFLSLPKALFEAAEIDGANEFRIFLTVALPLSRAVLVTVAIFTFTGVWNDFFSPLLYLTDPNRYTLGYGLYIFYSQCKIGTNRAWNVIAASSLLVALPVIVIFFCAQKYFVEGIALTGVKS